MWWAAVSDDGESGWRAEARGEELVQLSEGRDGALLVGADQFTEADVVGEVWVTAGAAVTV